MDVTDDKNLNDKNLQFHWHNNIPLAFTIIGGTGKFKMGNYLARISVIFLLVEFMLFSLALMFESINQGVFLCLIAISLFKFAFNFIIADYIQSIILVLKSNQVK